MTLEEQTRLKSKVFKTFALVIMALYAITYIAQGDFHELITCVNSFMLGFIYCFEANQK